VKKLLVASLALNLLLVAGIVVAFALEHTPKTFARRNAERRVSQFELLAREEGGIVFLGDSITQGGLWSELFDAPGVRNRGIGGDTTRDLLERAAQIHSLRPSKLFLMIGINDLNTGMDRDDTFANLDALFDGFDRELPKTKVYVQSVLPVNDSWWVPIDPADIDAINDELRTESDARGYTFVDLRPHLSDASGLLDPAYTNDGIHLTGAGYEVWRQQIAALVAAEGGTE
jgi:lysophospholipase L1-like esterase